MTTNTPNKPPVPSICILGLGQMGLVCANALDSSIAAQPSIRLWGHSEDEAGTLAQTRSSPRLPDYHLPARIRVALSDAEALKDADIIVNAIPVQFMRSTWERLKPLVPAHAAVISVAKGIENTTLLRPTQIISDVLGDNPDAKPRPIGCMSGPAIATELAKGLPATMAAASDHPGFAET
ncbi:MAG: NAD(P)-binding domain-containing protein, partial [Phycisphaerales bacterium]|nr:NAD(P)-binding domain-containing protein [Phycisphaerales bacterium]